MVLRKLFSIDSQQNGKGPVLFSWRREGSLLAVVGANRKVLVADRQGKIVFQFALPQPSPPIAIEWDSTGEMLAVLQDRAATISLWNSRTNKVDNLDTGLRELTWMKWARNAPLLAAANAKGSLLIYNHQTFKKIPLMGKHSKKISCGAWNIRNMLVLSGEDRTFTVSDAEGNTTDQQHLRTEPTNICFADVKKEGKATGEENTMSMLIGNRSLLLYTAHEAPKELAFQPSYGNIVTYKWFGDAYLLIGFASGHVVVVSTHEKEIGTEISSIRVHRDTLADVAYSSVLNKGASIGDGCVKVFDLEGTSVTDAKAEKFDLDNEFGALSAIEWTEDGQILTVSSRNGNVYSFLTKIPVLNDGFGTSVLFLSSLRELTVKDIVADKDIARIPIEIEPAFVSIGPGVAAVGMNTQVYYYTYAEKPGGDGSGTVQSLGSRNYGNIVEQVRLTSTHTAVLQGGRVTLQSFKDDKFTLSLPEKEGSGKVTSLALTDNFLIFSTQTGTLCYFSLLDHQTVCDFHHTCGIRMMSANPSGTRVFFVDDANTAFVFNPATEVTTTCEGFKLGTERVMWNTADYGVIIGVDAKHFITYVYSPNSRFGTSCAAVPTRIPNMEGPATTARPYGFLPILAYRGDVLCQMPSGSLARVSLATHSGISNVGKPDSEVFQNNLALNHLNDAFTTASNEAEFNQLAQKALHLLDIDMAIKVYRHLSQPAIVMFLDKIRHLREKTLLLGYVSMVFRSFNDAQNFFLRSSCPVLALDMRRDLMQWEDALQLANTMAPDQVPAIARDYGQQLEFRGEYRQALDMYRKAQMQVPHGRDDMTTHAAQDQANEHNAVCQSGIARCMLRIGDLRSGVQAALNSGNSQLCIDCASILEQMKQFEDAAALYDKANQSEKAASIYIKETKQLNRAKALLPKITSRNILVMYAKAKEAIEAAYGEALAAYEQAEDWDNVVRIKVEHLNDLHGAYVVVRKTRSADAAALVAKSCQKKGEVGTAVEFLLLARKTREAFELAQAHNVMTNFEQALIAQVQLKDGVAPPQHRDDFSMVARYYEDHARYDLAGDFYHIAGNFSQALAKYLQVGSDEYLQKAIAVVGKAKNDGLTHTLIDFLMGETDGEPKDPNCIFKLYMALNNYEKAAKTSVIIASKEQEVGNYRAAHKILVDTAVTLRQKGVRIPNDLRRALMLVHSYIAVRHVVKPLDDHYNAAQLLLRVARNIQKFPKHVTQILTSAILECGKVDFKASAHQYACVVIQHEAYHAEVAEKHRKKIETIVRKKGKEELTDPPEQSTPCPHCNAPVPEYTLDCGACKNTIPFCLVTGRHMTLDDWCVCPNCQFPALFSVFVKLLRAEPHCPLCGVSIEPQQLTKCEPDLKNS